MNRRVHFLIIILLIAAGIVPAITPPRAAAQSDHLTLWIRDDWAFLIDAFAAIGANSGVELVVEPKPSAELFDLYTEAVMAGEGPDILFGSDDWAYLLAQAGLVAPLAPGPWMDALIPFAMQTFTIGGGIYGVPAAMENLALVRNLEMVPDAPATWSDVFEIATRIHNSDENRYGLLLPDMDYYDMYPILSGFGSYIVGRNPDGTFNPADIGLNNANTVGAVALLQRLASEGVIPIGFDWGDVNARFYAGETGMLIAGVWLLGDLQASGVPFAVSAFPAQSQPSRPFVHVQGFMLNPRSPQMGAAEPFLYDHLASEDSMTILHDAFHRLPTHIAVFERIEDPHLLGFAQAAQNGQQLPSLPGIEIVWDATSRIIQVVRASDQDPKTALDNAAMILRNNLE